ncbi:MAG: nucleoside hydrolase [Clostridia bacterium]|nr:nucleoside hydrolase [Clostridia bacterium]
MKKYPLILDVDTGIDDAVAIVFASCLKNIDLKMLTTVHGNVELSKVITNTLTILEDVRKAEIPVYICEEKPIEINDFNMSVHGKNGLGNYEHKITTKAKKQNYLNAMHNEISKNEKTYIIACGPLTNIAKFIEKYPQDNDKIELILVTGMLENDSENPYLNFNLSKDVRACEIVLNSYKNITFVPSDMGHLTYIAQTDFDKTAKTGRVGKILANIYPYHLDRTVKDGAAMHDLCGVLYLSNPEIFQTKKARCELKSSSKGLYLSFDVDSEDINITLTTDINIKKMHKIYYKTLRKIK